MTNKYCNLDGSKKIKDEFKKINVGFDKVEEDVASIIVTPAEGVSEQEIIQARKGRSTLGARLDATDEKTTYLDTRIDQIISTPAGEISQQEIIDARQSKPSLGANLTSIKDDLIAHKEDYATNVFSLKNEVVNGNFEDESGWTVRNSTFTVVDNIATIQPKAIYGRISQSIATSAGDILYAKYNVETANKTFELAITDDSTYTHSYPISTGNSSVIMTTGVKSTSSRSVLMLRTRTSDFSTIKISWITIINLTKMFGKGHEPTQDEMDKLFKILPNQYVDGSEVLSQEDILVWQQSNGVQKKDELQDIHVIRSYKNDNHNISDVYDGDKITKRVGYTEIPLDWFKFYTTNTDVGVDRYRASGLFTTRGLLAGVNGLNNGKMYLDGTVMKPQAYWGNLKDKEDFVYHPTAEGGYVEIAIPAGTTLSSNYNGMKMTLKYPLETSINVAIPQSLTPNSTEIVRHSIELEDINERLMESLNKNNELEKTVEDIIRETYSIYGNNLISSPTFDNIEDWNLIVANVQYSTKDGAIILKGTSNISRIQQKIDHTDGNLLYRVAMVKSTSNKVGIGATTEAITKHSGSNEYEMLSSRSRSVVKYTSVVDNRDSNYDDIYIKYIATIDLTKTFGAGNEPSLTRMDHIMSKLGNNIGDLIPMVSLKTLHGILLEDVEKLNKKIDTLYIDTTDIGHINNPMKDDFKGQAMITMSYDDGYLDNYTRALPLHEKYGIPATFNIITNYTLGSNSFMNSSHLLDSFNRGVEIASHSTEHINMTQQTSPEIHLSMSQSKSFLEDIVGEGNVNTFAVPYATNTKEVNDIASQYYKGSRVYEVYTNSIPPTNRYALHSPIMVGNETTFKKIKDIIDLAVQERRWCIIILHSIVKDNPSQYAITEALLEQILSYINSFDRDKLLPINTVDALKFSLGEDY